MSRTPVRRQTLSRLFIEFVQDERASGLLLLACLALSLLATNSPVGPLWSGFWHAKVPLTLGPLSFPYTVEHWVNDGLMTVFFLLIGIEIRRELLVGELSNPRNASLPILAALGGMLVPILLHQALNFGTPTQRGFAIPMATDIAFTLGILSLLGPRAPASLKVFLTALAIVDDLGAILVIGLFFSSGLQGLALLGALAVFIVLGVLGRSGRARALPIYVVGGLVLWGLMSQSGVHPTLAGVMLAFTLPFDRDPAQSLSHQLEHALSKPVAFVIMPIFVMANTALLLRAEAFANLITPNDIGIFLGLVVGKPLGVLLLSWAGVRLGLSRLQADLTWRHILGGGMLAGIGFTMSFFITYLAFADAAVIESAKLSILISSFVAGTAGFVALSRIHARGRARALPAEAESIDG